MILRQKQFSLRLFRERFYAGLVKMLDRCLVEQEVPTWPEISPKFSNLSLLVTLHKIISLL